MSYTARPLVRVISTQTGQPTDEQVPLPEVFTSPIRSDVVRAVHDSLAKNDRQPYAVSDMAGEWATAHSWGTGRAVSRAPRVHGSGTHRSGQVSGANFARGARMSAPTKIWRRWHVKVSKAQRRYAAASALAATAVPALVMSRGHAIERVTEVPLVLSADAEQLRHTKDAVAALRACGAYGDVERAAASKKLRAGRGKMRNRRYTMRRGPLVIFAGDEGQQQQQPSETAAGSRASSSSSKPTCARAFRNLPGVECVHVDRLSVLDLAPGGHLGRFCVFTKPAFERLEALYASHKGSFRLPRAVMSQADLTRIINSDEVQSVLRPAQPKVPKPALKRNALRNKEFMRKLNPAYDAIVKLASQPVAAAAATADKAPPRRSRRLFIRRLLQADTEGKEEAMEEEEAQVDA